MDEKYKRALDLFELWLARTSEEDCVREELSALNEKLSGPERQEALQEIYEAFYKDLEFGTGGLRGILGAGTNRMNIYTIGKATQGLATYILAHYKDNPSVAISYDSRINSKLFAHVATRVMASNGIKVYLYPELAPTPMLSFAVRYYKAAAGIMVTASHNPAKYNGYKVYNHEGCQMTIAAADEVLSYIEGTDTFDGVKNLGKGQVPMELVSEAVYEAYFAEVLKAGIPTDCSKLDVVYSPLNGSGLKPVTRILKDINVGSVHIVKSQEEPDGNFPTCPYPNPEKKEALAEGLKLCEALKTPDLLIATDPDCDRMGIAVKDGGEYKLLTGNEVGVLLLDFLCQKKPILSDSIVIKTIVTTGMASDICKAYGLECREVLTGFKFIGEIAGQLEREGREDRYFFGFEESYGYLSGAYVRDKDAVDAAMLVCQMAASYKAQGLTLVNKLMELYERYGCYVDTLKEFTFEGAAGMEAMNRIMNALRTSPPNSFGGSAVIRTIDYKNDDTGLPKSDVVRFYMENGSGLIARPSGTEPKLKIYLSSKEGTRQASLDVIDIMKQEIAGFTEAHKE